MIFELKALKGAHISAPYLNFTSLLSCASGIIIIHQELLDSGNTSRTVQVCLAV